MLEALKNDISIIAMLIINVVLFLCTIITFVRVNRMNRITKEFMKKIGDGKDIREDLNKYIDRIVDLETGLTETNSYCKQMDNRLKGCVQKVGIVRYNAYRDSGNNLSFAVSLLDENNTGIVFNGIYSREMSNIYAKPIEKGSCKFNLTDEEKQAVSKAINSFNK